MSAEVLSSISTYLSRTMVIARGWTPALIKKHLREADVSVKDRQYREPIRLYKRSRVEEKEKERWFAALRKP